MRIWHRPRLSRMSRIALAVQKSRNQKNLTQWKTPPAKYQNGGKLNPTVMITKEIVRELMQRGAINKENALEFDYKHGNAPHFQREEALCGIQEGYIARLWYESNNGIMADFYIITCGAYFMNVMLEQESQLLVEEVLNAVENFKQNN